jgi:galactofuranosylgalactofuranosylrhamnosyl-N-acetylglucosaminyl-diphospho-decaprenol beta-1,5/1,6-galactofuranosyltransferase
MGDLLVQRLVRPPNPRLARLYYRVRGKHAQSLEPHPSGVSVRRGTVLTTDTYFNAFFEDYWRTHTRLAKLDVRLCVSGAATVRVFRRPEAGGRQQLAEASFDGAEAELQLSVPEPQGESGLLFFEIGGASSDVTVHRADWVARDVPVRPVRLAVGYCTYEREVQLLSNLRRLLRDRSLGNLLGRIVVTDQGGRKVRAHPGFAMVAARAGDRLLVVEQNNFGGAGGFTRCIVEALKDSGLTHILLTDDDADIHPESVRRAATFLALAREAVAVGGHLLDRRQRSVLVDVGGRYYPDRVAVAPSIRRRVGRRPGLAGLQRARQTPCNGWWCFAFPLRATVRAGLPLPLFLRGDDVEFGCRLALAGTPTIPLPGVAVRHEAIDQARRGWQVYYDLRNMLIVGALRFRLTRRAVLKRFLAGLLGELLAYRYAQAWLLCEAAEGYLSGPKHLPKQPWHFHQRLLATWKAIAPERMPAPVGQVDDGPSRPRSRLRRLAAVVGQLVRNATLPDPSPSAPLERVIEERASDWYAVRGADVVAVTGKVDGVVLRRSRTRFLRLLLRSAWLSVRLFFEHRRVVRAWRDGASRLTTMDFWRDYLALDESQRQGGRHSSTSKAARRAPDTPVADGPMQAVGRMS